MRLTRDEIEEIRKNLDAYGDNTHVQGFLVRRLLAHISALEEELEDATEKLGMRAIFIDELKDERDAARAEIARLMERLHHP